MYGSFCCIKNSRLLCRRRLLYYRISDRYKTLRLAYQVSLEMELVLIRSRLTAGAENRVDIHDVKSAIAPPYTEMHPAATLIGCLLHPGNEGCCQFVEAEWHGGRVISAATRYHAIKTISTRFDQGAILCNHLAIGGWGSFYRNRYQFLGRHPGSKEGTCE